MTRLFLVRHGETAWNAEGRIQGHADEPLNEMGRYQAQRLAARLSVVAFVAAYTSDLSRARETMESILAGHKHVRQEAIHDLREISHGAWEGLTYQEVLERFPDVYRRRFAVDDSMFAPPGGESMADLLQRVSVFINRLRTETEYAAGEDNILIVSHGGPLRALLLHLLDLSVACFWHYSPALGSVSIVALPTGSPSDATLELWNDTSHLEEGHE